MEWKGKFSTVYSCCILLAVSSLASAARAVGTPPTSEQPLATTYSGSLNRVTQGRKATSSLAWQRLRSLTGYKIDLFCWQIHLNHVLFGWQQEDSFLYCGSSPLNQYLFPPPSVYRQRLLSISNVRGQAWAMIGDLGKRRKGLPDGISTG